MTQTMSHSTPDDELLELENGSKIRITKSIATGPAPIYPPMRFPDNHIHMVPTAQSKPTLVPKPEVILPPLHRDFTRGDCTAGEFNWRSGELKPVNKQEERYKHFLKIAELKATGRSPYKKKKRKKRAKNK